MKQKKADQAAEAAALEPLLKERAALVQKALAASRDDFYLYVKLVAPVLIPGFKLGRHIELICNKLQAVEEGKIKRLMLFLSPGSMKSLLASVLFPSWCLGRHPAWYILAVSHSYELAEMFGRRTRNLIDEPEYKGIFPETVVSPDSRAAARWNTTAGGMYYAAGAGSGIAGFRAHVALLDDTLSEQTATSKLERSRINSWYFHGLTTRLLPEGRIILVNCLAEGTRISLANGGWKPIEHVEPGDCVVSWENGMKVAQRVYGSWDQGEVETLKVVTGNSTVFLTAEHPLLVDRGKRVAFIPAKNLKVGDKIVYSLTEQSEQNPFELGHDACWLLGFMYGDGWVTRKRLGRKTKHVYLVNRWVTCAAKGVHEDVNSRFLDTFEKIFACAPVETKFGYWRSDKAHVGKWFDRLGFGGKAKSKRLSRWIFKLPRDLREAFLQGFVAADGHYTPSKQWVVGLCNENLVADIKLLVEGLGYKVSNIWKTETWTKAPNSKEPILAKLFKISWGENKEANGSFATTTIKAIEPGGKRKVFDLSVEGSENFIANGLVSHNTRWAPDDLSGYLLKLGANNPQADQWEVIEIPALLDEPAAKLLKLPAGTSYWPEMWSTAELEKKRENIISTEGPRFWSALYQQKPVAEEGNLFKEKWLRWWQDDDPPTCNFVLQSLDTAYSTKEHADFSVIQTWGIFMRRAVLSDDREVEISNLILLGNEVGRWEYPELRRKAQALYKEHKPDMVIVEKKASGQTLIQDLRLAGVPLYEYLPDRDKVSRAHAASGLVEAGRLWLPLPAKHAFSTPLVEQMMTFPLGDHDDMVDAMVQAILYMRDTWRLKHPRNPEHEAKPRKLRTYWT